jgi:heme exporter protein A
MLAAEGLALTRGNRPLFSDVSLAIEAGEALVLRGANGSGKTSLLRILAGLTVPDGGVIRWAGVAMRGLNAVRRHNTLYLGHTNALKDELTAAENLADALAFDGDAVDEKSCTAALARVGLGDRLEVPVRRLSQGQKRRIGLARLSISKRRLWLLDEPTNALDQQGVSLFSDIVQRHLSSGGMACIATHLTLPLESRSRDLFLGGAA